MLDGQRPEWPGRWQNASHLRCSHTPDWCSLVARLPNGALSCTWAARVSAATFKKSVREVIMIKPVQKRTFVYGAALALTVGSIGVGVSALRGTAAEQPIVEIPIFEVDPLWPKPLPEEALLGMT